MIYLFFIYGLSFFLMGFSIFLYPKKQSQYKCANNLWLVAVFAISHGMGEWIEMFILIEQSQSLLLHTLSLMFLGISFLFLLCFGLQMLDEKFLENSFGYLLVFIGAFCTTGYIITTQSFDPLLVGNIFIRYCIGLPGILLTSYGFYLWFQYIKAFKLVRVQRAIKLLILSFSIYGLSAGLVVPEASFFPASLLNYNSFSEVFGFPIQILRTFFAFVTAYAMIVILSIFRYEAELKLEKLASTDKLTGIYNRMKFDEHLVAETSKAQRNTYSMSLILLDIDNFKDINDTYGHIQGDKALQSIAELIKKNIRLHDVCARWGGEEFVILMSDTQEEDASAFAERIRMEIEMCYFNNIKHLTASFGVSQFKMDESIDTLMKRVDDALYKAKGQGRNCVVSS